MTRMFLLGASAALIMAGGQAWAGTDRSAGWQAQIGDTATVQAQSNGGAGITIGIVDTGLVASNSEVAGRVSSASGCAAVSFKCANGFNDDNGHGTSVASIAAGRFNASAPTSMSGVAPNATILSEKVLNASGSGYDTDVASGIRKAADGGAQVINLSVSYVPTATVISAVNYATAKGATLVWAGGNSNAKLNNGANTTGLTTTSLSRLILVGSVNSANTKSSFSNTPGTAYASAGTKTASYASLWLVAPGEGIVAPNIKSGPTAYAGWSGTSMSTPEVAGAVALLEATWPILRTNGTVASVLFTTARDLGAAGVDSTYGNGLLDLTKAFQPVGTLTVTSTSGSSIPVSQVNSSVVSSGALGPMSSISGQLSHYTAFDTFKRNFTVDLSGMISQPSASGSAGATTAPVTPTPVVHRKFLAGGGYVMVAAAQTPSFAQQVFGADGSNDISNRMFGARDRNATLVTLVDRAGNMISVGHGVSSTAGFANAMWGADTLAADQSDRLGVSTALVGLAQGGYSTALGYNLGDRVRVALGWSGTDQFSGTGQITDRTHSTAKATVVGVNARLTRRLTAGVSFGTLTERNGLLGATYDGAGALTLGARHKTRSMSVTSAYDLGGGRAILVDATMLDSSGSAMSGGLIRDVSPLKARAFGVSYMRQDALRAGDRFTLSVRKPLRVVSGQASLAITTVDADGYPVTTFAPVSLAPSGNETDMGMAYATPVSKNVRLNGGVEYRSDVRNIQGLRDVAFRFGVNASF